MRLVAGTATVESVDSTLETLGSIGEETGCTVQAFDARYVASPDHLRRALRLADRAIERGENVARDRGIEVTLYAAGRRQIDDALRMGLSEGTIPVVALIAAASDDPGDSTPGELTDDPADASDDPEATAAKRVASLLTDARHVDPTSGELRATEPDRLRSFFEITDRELAATDATLAELVTERVALLDVRK